MSDLGHLWRYIVSFSSHLDHSGGRGSDEYIPTGLTQISLSPLFPFSILLLKTLHPFFSFFWNDFLVAIAFRFLLTLNKPTIEKLYQLKTSPLFISSEDKFKDLIFHWVKKIDIILATQFAIVRHETIFNLAETKKI